MGKVEGSEFSKGRRSGKGDGTEVGRSMGGETAHRTLDEMDKIPNLGCLIFSSRFNLDLTSDLD